MTRYAEDRGTGFYEALAPLGLPEPERHSAGRHGWARRVLGAMAEWVAGAALRPRSRI